MESDEQRSASFPHDPEAGMGKSVLGPARMITMAFTLVSDLL